MLIVLLLPITSCVTTKKAEIVLPPKPERVEQPEAESIQDMAKLISYYNTLVLTWEEWGRKVEKITGAKYE